MKRNPTIGIYGIGLDTYWPQFDGLLSRLLGYQQVVVDKLSTLEANIIDGGMVDNPQKANEAAMLFQQKKVDALFIFISTYALSQNVLPVAQKLKVPVIVLNLQPQKAIDYKQFNSLGDRGKMTGEWLAFCQSCVAPEISSVFIRSNIQFELITGYLHEDYVWQQSSEFIEALRVQKEMTNNRVGLLGRYYNGMLDVYSDLTQLIAIFGNHFEILEMGMLKAYRDQVTDIEIIEKRKDFEANGDKDYRDIVTSLIPGFTLLTGRNVPIAGEYEVKNVLAMKIMDLLGFGGSFSEFYAMDFNDNIILLGHDGPAHFAIAEGKVGLVPLSVYHGKPGNGLSIQMKVKPGPVTLFSICQDGNGKVHFLVAEGVSEDGPTLQIGNTNSRYRFNLPIRDFMDQWSKAGPSHHCAIGIGHKASVLKKLAWILKIKFIQI